MNKKDPVNKSLPGVPEALHPEIGNGLFMEMDAHKLVLRNPDPLKAIEMRLMDPETNDLIFENWEEEIKTDKQIDIPVASEPSSKTNDILHEEHLNVEPIKDIEQSGQPIEEVPPSTESDPQDEPRKSKKKIRGDKPSILSEGPREEVDNPASPKAKPTKAGKLIRKAAKTIQKQEETKEDIRREEEKQAPVETIALSEQNLSPFTQWLKRLRGSDYVHPYDDDFAISQGAGPAKEGISETFADLLAAQGYKEQAIEMYIKLIAKYPEKSGFFAAKIEALQ